MRKTITKMEVDLTMECIGFNVYFTDDYAKKPHEWPYKDDKLEY